MKSEKAGCVLLIALLILVAVCTAIWRYKTEDTTTITVERGERVVKASGKNVSSYYLIWAVRSDGERETFSVRDDLFHGKFLASDTYGRLMSEPGKKVFKVKTTGKRVGWADMYRNIYLIVDEVPNGTLEKAK